MNEKGKQITAFFSFLVMYGFSSLEGFEQATLVIS